MPEISFERVVERLAQLEAENCLLARKVQWWGRFGLASILGVFVTVACGAALLANPDVKPGQIIVSDPGGSKAAISLFANQDGASLDIFGPDGKRQVNISGGKFGPLITRSGPDGNPLP